MKIATRPRKSAADERGLVVRRHGANGRSYRFDGAKFVSVSDVKNTFPKHLADWGARVERAHVLDVLEALIDHKKSTVHGALWVRDLLGFELRAAVLEECGPHAWTRALNEAGTIGHEVHAAIEHYNAWRKYKAGDGPDPGQTPDLTTDFAENAFDKFMQWAIATDYTPIASEISVCSPTHKWGGTLDDLSLVEGRTAIVDWKTGPRVYLEDELQVTAYLHGYNEYEPAQVRGFPRADVAILVNIPKGADDEPTNIVTIGADRLPGLYETFLMAVPLTYRLQAYKAARDAAKAVAK